MIRQRCVTQWVISDIMNLDQYCVSLQYIVTLEPWYGTISSGSSNFSD